MAITGITISQSSIVGGVNLLSVHNPLVFIADVAYTSGAPDLVNVAIYDSESVLLGTFAAIPYNDLTGVRQFVFIATDLLKAYMDSFDDFKSLEKVLEYVDGITKEFTLSFYDPGTPATNAEIDFVACHAASQFGETPYLERIYTNEDDIYYTGEGCPVYVYLYNNDENNVITVGTGEIILDVLLDYDSIALVDFDDQYLIAL